MIRQLQSTQPRLQQPGYLRCFQVCLITVALALCVIAPVDRLRAEIESSTIESDTIEFNIDGHPYRRLQIAIRGSEQGWVVKGDGLYNKNISDAPGLVFTQLGVEGEPVAATAHYQTPAHAGITLFLPQNKENWNGKLFVTVHGSSAYGGVGTLIPRDPGSEFNPLLNANKYAGLLIDKGYAVAHTSRMAAVDKGDVRIELTDGTVIEDGTIGFHAGLILSWTRLAKQLVAQHLGTLPQRTYYYGFSAGGMIGRQINYLSGMNTDEKGNLIFDGILNDDAGAGFWLPQQQVDARDIILTDLEARNRFVPQLDLMHQAYSGRTRPYPSLQNHRDNAIMLLQKGLGERHRIYEIRGVSHFDAGYGPDDIGRGRDLIHQNLDLGGLMEAMIDALDRWVMTGVALAANRSDDPRLGNNDADPDLEQPAIALPEIACPLGVYHIYPPSLGDSRMGDQTTGFAAYDGVNPEPIDGKDELVDMNGNGIRDQRETVTAAWTRLGLLAPGASFSRAAYVYCVDKVVTELTAARLIPARVGEYYRALADTRALAPQFR